MADTTVAGSKALHRDFLAKVPPGMQTPKFPSTLPRKHYHASALTPRASPDNPFLASPLDPESAALMNKPDRLGVLEEEGQLALKSIVAAKIPIWKDDLRECPRAQKLHVPVFAYCHDTVTEARKTGRNLLVEIKECKTWSVICIDPEHLWEKTWREITASDTFRANLVYGCTDEAHSINQWGEGFRPDFKNIGIFFRGRLLSTISVIASLRNRAAWSTDACHLLKPWDVWRRFSHSTNLQ
ncbi:hypothetical protein B0H14DRAFT_3504029 [Mycena olivaceomarginata]|nr:hypothetical protein B0H14DRAFT_3504029 [Mycena olivaceomarginata]